jgi:hypothetical protein
VYTFDRFDEAIVRADTTAGYPDLADRKVVTIDCDDGSTVEALVYVTKNNNPK